MFVTLRKKLGPFGLKEIIPFVSKNQYRLGPHGANWPMVVFGS